MSIAEQIQHAMLFREVEPADLEALVERMKPETYPLNHVLFQAGDPGDTMYIILSGRIRIYMLDKDGEEITLTYYGKNEIFGELSPIDLQPRSASASATEPLEVLSLKREDFLIFLNERPQIGLAMMRSLSQRLRNTTAYLEAARPSRFVKPVAPTGEEFRRAADATLSEILERAAAHERDEHIEVPKAADMPHPTEPSIKKAPEPPVESAKTNPPTEPTKPTGMGIFDRIAAAAKDDETKDPTKEDNNP
jgi:CRP-like cAMP-binding protein